MTLSARRPIEMSNLSATSIDRLPDLDILVRLFRDPWQTQLMHLDSKLEDVVETRSSR
jgi:hypothetical protein